MSIFVGKLIRKMSKNNKEFFVGSVGKFPIIANWGTKKPDEIYLKLDLDTANYRENKDKKSKEEAKEVK